MARSCHVTLMKIKDSNLLKFGAEANLRLIYAYNPALGWT